MKLAFLCLVCLPAVLFAQELTPDALKHPRSDTWPTYNGDYTGRRNSPLTQVNPSNVGDLGLQWIYHASNSGLSGFAGSIKSTPLLVKGVLYFTMPDNAWAVDARTGSETLALQIPQNPGVHIGNRGVGMYGDWFTSKRPIAISSRSTRRTGRSAGANRLRT